MCYNTGKFTATKIASVILARVGSKGCVAPVTVGINTEKYYNESKNTDELLMRYGKISYD